MYVMYTDIAARSLTCHTTMGTHMPCRITVLPATQQRWHSRLYPSLVIALLYSLLSFYDTVEQFNYLYPSWSWYSIKWPQRDARLSWTSTVASWQADGWQSCCRWSSHIQPLNDGFSSVNNTHGILCFKRQVLHRHIPQNYHETLRTIG